MADPTPFTIEAVTAIVRHMNEDHASDTLDICRASGRCPDATAASVADLGPTGLELLATVDGVERLVHVDWPEVPADRPGIRHQIIRLCEIAERDRFERRAPPQ